MSTESTKKSLPASQVWPTLQAKDDNERPRWVWRARGLAGLFSNTLCE